MHSQLCKPRILCILFYIPRTNYFFFLIGVKQTLKQQILHKIYLQFKNCIISTDTSMLPKQTYELTFIQKINFDNLYQNFYIIIVFLDVYVSIRIFNSHIIYIILSHLIAGLIKFAIINKKRASVARCIIGERTAQLTS